MEPDEHHHAGPARSPSSLQRDSLSPSQLRTKLQDKLGKLAAWRIQPSLIGFPSDGHEIRGGYAIVTRAFLSSPSDPGRQDSGPMEGANNDSKEDENKHEEQQPSGQTSERRVVAVKKMRIERNTDIERVLGLALRELEFLVEFSHPNVIKLKGFVEDSSNNVIWLVFPWEENGNLRDFLASGEGQWQIPERISLINDVTIGLEFLHSQNPPICHGDLKSLNILVNSEYHAMITDFGSARRLKNDSVDKRTRKDENKPQPVSALDPTIDQENTQLLALFCATTNTITLTGNGYTLRWAAPELLKDERPCLGSDIWALGWIAYEVMTNTIPFHDIKNENIVVNRVVQGDLPSITNDARMSLIRALCSLMAQCWSINPDKRPTAEDCRKLISWMPMIAPEPDQITDTEESRARNAILFWTLGEMYSRQGDYRNALDSLTKALNIHSSALPVDYKAQILCSLADLHMKRGEYSEADSFGAKALQTWTDADDQYQNGRADALFRLGEIRRLKGEYGDSIKLYSEALQIHTDSGVQRGRALALWGLASSYVCQAEYSTARSLYSQALEIYTDIGDQREMAVTLWGLAEIHRFERDFTEATKLYTEALRIYSDVGDKREIALNLGCLALIHRIQGEYSEAIERYSESLRIATEIGNKPHRANLLMSLAEVHREQDHHDEAISFFMEASEAYGEIGQSEQAANALKAADGMRKSLEMGRMMEALEVE